MNNLLVAQSGGPTAAINATLCGVVKAAMVNPGVGKVLGGLNGIEGILAGRIIDIGGPLSDPDALRRLQYTPASALGSCRVKLPDPAEDEAPFRTIREVFRENGVRFFLYIGGNDSMDTVAKLSAYLQGETTVVGVPKTLDNDLYGTDHTPGFGSGAKYLAATMAELKRDVLVYDRPAVTVVEIMGRNAGWLTAASALGRDAVPGAPNLIYLPEVPFTEEKFIEDIRRAHGQEKALLVAVGEGIRYPDGSYVGEGSQLGTVDAYGHKYLEGVSGYLARVVKERIGCKTRGITLNLMQRCSSHIASAADLMEAEMQGQTGVALALEGRNGCMVSLRRLSNHPYRIAFSSVDAASVANREKPVPPEYIHTGGNDVTEKLLQYVRPLIRGEVPVQWSQGIPVHFAFDREEID